MKRTARMISALVLAVCLVLSGMLPGVGRTAEAAKVKVTLNRTLYEYKANYGEKLSRKTIQLKAKVKGSSEEVKWKSSDKSVATVSKKGLVRMKGTGSCLITATVGSVSASCRIRVRQQSGSDYYKKKVKNSADTIGRKMKKKYSSSYDVQNAFEEAKNAADKLKSAVNTISAWKKDSNVKTYLKNVINNIKRGQKRAGRANANDSTLMSYQKNAATYLEKLVNRIKEIY